MANKKISDFTAGSALAAADLFEVEQGGNSRKVTAAQVQALSGLVLISEVVTSGSQTSVTFSSIAATYRDLIVVSRGRGTTVANSTAVLLRFNGDTGSNYDYETISGAGTTATVAEALAQTSIRFGNMAAASAGASIADVSEVVIGDYRGTTFQKSVVSRYGIKIGTSTGNIGHSTLSGWWRSTAAITSVVVFPSAGGFVNGSVVSLYGRM